MGKSAHAAWNKGDIPGCVEVLKEAITRYPGEPTFLMFACELATAGKSVLAEAIAKAYIKAKPFDARGYGTLAAVFNAQYARSEGMMTNLLPAIEENLIAAEKLGELDPEAELAKCNLMRYQHYPREIVTQAYEHLIQNHKQYAVAYYNFGLHCLVDDYEKALLIFTHGASLAPKDANFILGQIRALIKLDRDDEAWALMAKAKTLNPSKAHLEKVMRMINSKKSAKK